MFWKKKPKCDHDWHELSRETDYTFGFTKEDFIYIYCPKCDDKRCEGLTSGENLIKASQIKKEYLSKINTL